MGQLWRRAINRPGAMFRVGMAGIILVGALLMLTDWGKPIKIAIVVIEAAALIAWVLSVKVK